MTITLTDAALDHLRTHLAAEPGALGLRLGVERTGCSGWGYVARLAHEQEPDDLVFEQQGVRVLVDAKSLPLLDGTEVDYVRQGLNRQFAFRNPNVTAACGCGESFTTDPEALP